MSKANNSLSNHFRVTATYTVFLRRPACQYSSQHTAEESDLRTASQSQHRRRSVECVDRAGLAQTREWRERCVAEFQLVRLAMDHTWHIVSDVFRRQTSQLQHNSE